MTTPNPKYTQEQVDAEYAGSQEVHGACLFRAALQESHTAYRALQARVEELTAQRNDEAWQHAACLSIAEGQADDGKEVANQSLAMKAVLELRRRYVNMRSKFDGGETPLVCATHLKYACGGCREAAESKVKDLTAQLATMTAGFDVASESDDFLREKVKVLTARVEELERDYKINNATWLEAREARLKAESKVADLESELAKAIVFRTEETARELKDLEAKLAEAEKSRDFTSDWYKERFDRMDKWMRESAPSDAKNQYFSIQANGISTPWERPAYVETIHALKMRAQSAEAREKAAVEALEKWDTRWKAYRRVSEYKDPGLTGREREEAEQYAYHSLIALERQDPPRSIRAGEQS